MHNILTLPLKRLTLTSGLQLTQMKLVVVFSGPSAPPPPPSPTGKRGCDKIVLEMNPVRLFSQHSCVRSENARVN